MQVLSRVATAVVAVVLVSLSALLGGCSSTGGGASGVAASGTPGAVSLVNGGKAFILLNDALLAEQGVPGDTPEQRRAAFYSAVRDNGLLKITSDARFAELVDAFGKIGFQEYAADGSAPDSTQAWIELDTGGTRRYVPKPDTSNPTRIDKAALQTYTDLTGVVVAVFNETRAFQNVENQSNQIEFKQPELNPRLMGYVSSTSR